MGQISLNERHTAENSPETAIIYQPTELRLKGNAENIILKINATCKRNIKR